MDMFQYLCIGLGGICLIEFLLLVFINYRYSKTLRGMRGRSVEDVNQKNNVRYTINQTVVDEEGNATVSLSTKDIVLNPNETIVVDKKGKLKPGKYTILASNEKETTFNIRIGTYVKEYSHNQSIILSEGQEVTAVNCPIILR
jgi:hypothetical protein